MRKLRELLKTVRIVNFAYRVLWPTKKGGWPRISLRDHLTAISVWRRFIFSDQYFGGSYLYQSYEPMHLPGVRPTARRFDAYGLDSVLKPGHSILDIGCNMGLFSLYCAPRVSRVVAIDTNPYLIDIANYVQRRALVANCAFKVADFRTFTPGQKFDVVFAFAVHGWLELSLDQFAMSVSALLCDNGYLLVESHNFDRVGSDFDEQLSRLPKSSFFIVATGMTNFDTPRKFALLQKVN